MPQDPATGLPYPILLSPDDAPPPGLGIRELREDYDHAWFNHMNPHLRGRGGLTLRYSFGQDLPRWKHEIKNERYLEPRYIPEKDDEDEQFRLAVLGTARLISPLAIDVTSDDDWSEPVHMTPVQYAWVTDPSRMHTEGRTARRARTVRTHMGKFFAAYAINQDIGHIITPRVIKDFLHTKDPVRKRELGNLLLRESLEVAVEPLQAVKLEVADRYGMPGVKGIDLARKLRKYFPKERFADYYGVLTTRLLEAEVSWS